MDGYNIYPTIMIGFLLICEWFQAISFYLIDLQYCTFKKKEIKLNAKSLATPQDCYF